MLLLLRQIGILFANGVKRALLGLVEQVGEADDLAAACLEWPAVLAEDAAEMYQIIRGSQEI